MDKAAFSNDAREFRSEKWIEADPDQLKLGTGVF
jgi:hypothetical protein